MEFVPAGPAEDHPQTDRGWTVCGRDLTARPSEARYEVSYNGMENPIVRVRVEHSSLQSDENERER